MKWVYNGNKVEIGCQDAIKTLHELRRETIDFWYQETYYIAISAIERQIPRKTRIAITKPNKLCGSCGRKLAGIGNKHPRINYFPVCGQAIDWEDVGLYDE